MSVFRFLTPASAIWATLAATRDCFRGRASLQNEVIARSYQLPRSRTLGEATEADHFGSVLLGMFGSHLAELAFCAHGSRTHLKLQKDTPESRPIQAPEGGRIVAIPEVGGLHHRYERRAA